MIMLIYKEVVLVALALCLMMIHVNLCIICYIVLGCNEMLDDTLICFFYKEKESDKANSNVAKRRRRKQRVQEEENASRLQVRIFVFLEIIYKHILLLNIFLIM